MPEDNTNAIAVLDELIAEKEKDVSRLRLTMARLHQASTDLASLKRTREILSGEPDSRMVGVTSVSVDPYFSWAASLSPSSLSPSKNVSVTTHREDPTKGLLTLSDRVEVQIRKAGKPLHVDVITDNLRSEGLAGVTKQTVTAILAREAKKEDGRFVKTGANTFGLRARAA
jgi:hypothetical protein